MSVLQVYLEVVPLFLLFIILRRQMDVFLKSR